MSKQPEALRLADALDVGEVSYTGMCKAAAELRRLHSVNAVLLETLKLIASAENSALDLAYCKGIARAAISEGQ
jgi:hypothetical protein